MKSIDLFVSNDLATDQRIMRISYWLVQHGWTVSVTGTRQAQSLQLTDRPYKMTRVKISPRSGFLFYACINIVFFLRALRSTSAVLMAIDLDTLPAVRLAAWITRKSLVWDCHEIYTAIPELYSKPLVRKFWTLIEQLFAPGILHVLTVTAGVRDHLHRFGLEPMVIHNYPVFRDLKTNERTRFESKIILFQGHLNEGRCLDTLLDCLSRLPDSFTLQIAGDGHLRDQLSAFALSIGVQDRVQFLGMLQPEDLYTVTTNAFLGISLLDSQHENSRVSLANKNLDYIMAGLPCITMDFPEYRAINEQWPVAVLLSDEVNADSLADEIRSLAIDFEKYTTMHQACMVARSVLNWGQEANKLDMVFGRF